MFPQSEVLSKDIYVVKNFLSQEQCKEIVSALESLQEDQWVFDRSDTTHYKRTDPLEYIKEVRNKMLPLIPDNLHLGKSTSAIRMTKGNSWGLHSDVHDFTEIEKMALEYSEENRYEEKELSVFGTVIYFNEFEGGEIYYPQHDIIYKPAPGDLVIHSSSNSCIHGVKELISEKRYSYSNHIYKIVRVPIK